MAALCGPSNTLQNLQQHTSADKSLQQDRVRRQKTSASQSFRSTSEPPGGVDYELGAFAGIAQDATLLQHHIAVPAPTPLQQTLPAWASEFQGLVLDNTLAAQKQLHPSPPAQFEQAWTVPVASTPNWHEEFLQQASEVRTPVHTNAPFPYPTLFAQRRLTTAEPHHHEQHATTCQNTPSKFFAAQQQSEASDAAFELAFQQAESWQMEMQHDALDSVSAPVNVHEEESEAVTKRETQEADAEKVSDELARTAGRLLESLSGNQDEKFRQSTFLALMRKLRDKEVKVKGDQMVEATN